MKCRCCGRDVKALGDGLVSSYGARCDASSTKKHIAITDGENCVYCGRKVRPLGGNLTTEYGQRCKNSPTGKHTLQ